MASKRNPPTHELFESVHKHGKFTKIADSMMDSAAWLSLEPSQMGLYMLFKRKYTKSKAGDDNRANISFPFSEYTRIKTYSNQRTFWRDFDLLIDRGFLKVIASGKTTRTSSIYGFSDEWKRYGTPDFNVDINQRRAVKKNS